MKALKILAIVLIVGVLTTALLWRYNMTAPTASAQRVITIGALLALTGPAANYGISLRQGISLAVDEINASGGINGTPLKVIYEDSQADTKKGALAFSKLADIDHVPVVIGSISSVVLAVAPQADRKGVVLINSSAISPKICEMATNYLFSVMVSGAEEARFMASTFHKRHPDDPIAILFSNNASGIDTKNTFSEALQHAGGNVAIAEAYDLNASDFRIPLAKIKQSGANFGYLIAFSSNEFAQILKQSRELGLSLQWISYSGFETRETLQLAGPAAEGVIYSYPDYSASKERIALLQEKYQALHDGWADIYTVTSYDAIYMLKDVIAQHGADAANIKSALTSSSYETAFGTVTFGDIHCVDRALTLKTVRNGAFTLEK